MEPSMFAGVDPPMNSSSGVISLTGNVVMHHATAMATQGTGESSPVVHMLEVWVFDAKQNQLVLEPGCSWIDPSFRTLFGENEQNGQEGGDNVEDWNAEEDNQLAVVLSPGVCLAGILWANSRPVANYSSSSSFRLPKTTKKLCWRSLESLLLDPDTTKTDRLRHLKEAGLDWATGVPFDSHGVTGIVVYLSSVPHVDDDGHSFHQDMLDHEVHDQFLLHSAALLGTTVAMTKAKQNLLEAKRQQQQPNTSAAIATGEAQESAQSKNDTTKSSSCCAACGCCCHNPLSQKLWTVLQKSKGSGMPIPPRMTTQQAAWTWLGTFLTLLVLAGINQAFVRNTDDQKLLIGPFGALMTLQYGLTAAPASQPLNAVLGQVVSGAISIAITQIPGLPLWFQQALGPSFSVAAMCRLGIPHPPAGAHAVLYASGDDKWSLYAIVVMSAIVCCICATAINNFSEKRQYPTYWGPETVDWGKKIQNIFGADGGRDPPAKERVTKQEAAPKNASTSSLSIDG